MGTLCCVLHYVAGFCIAYPACPALKNKKDTLLIPLPRPNKSEAILLPRPAVAYGLPILTGNDQHYNDKHYKILKPVQVKRFRP